MSERTIRATYWLALVAASAWLVTQSWMRWMDPFVDFGREVYLPWRITLGEHLGRDFVHPYGPLSVYWNDGLFAVFGVSIQVLVVANLAVFAAIVIGLQRVLERAFGFFASACATVLAVTVFGFAHYWGQNNYTYAAPYSHEASHGMLILIGLLLWLGGSKAFKDGKESGFVAGALMGLCCLTKTEYVLVVAVLWGMCVALLKHSPALRPRLKAWVAGSIAGVLGVLGVAWIALICVMPPLMAGKTMANAVLAPFLYGAYSRSTHVLAFLGANAWAANLKWVILAGGGALAAMVLLTIAGRAVLAGSKRYYRFGYLGVISAAALVTGAQVSWVFCGSAFPVLLVAGAVLTWRKTVAERAPEKPPGQRAWNQWIVWAAGSGMLVRMAFDPTISHYGFFQAMLAAVWLFAFLISEWPPMVTSERNVRLVLAGAVVVMIGLGAGSLLKRSLGYYQAKQVPLGEGADRIFGYVPNAYALPKYWDEARKYVDRTTAPADSVLVLPEGVTLNYWTRRKHPLPILDVLPATLLLHPGDVLDRLRATPPELIVLVSRNMEELGFAYYGQDDATRVILEWMMSNYTPEGRAGDDPLIPGKVGISMFRRKRA